MSKRHFPEESKIEAPKQGTKRGYPVAEVGSRLGVSTHSLYQWLKRYAPKRAIPAESTEQQAEIRRLKTELKRVTEERDILKKGRRILCQGVRVSYAFIRTHEQQFPVRCLCRARLCTLVATTPGKPPRIHLVRAKTSAYWANQAGLARDYGYRKVYDDQRALGECCSKHRVVRLMK